MSRQPAPTDPQQSHAAQVGIAVAAAPALRAAFSKIPATGSWDTRAWALGVAAIIRRHAAASAALAVRHYKQERSAAGVTKPFTPRPQEPTLAQIGSATDWTLGTLYGDGGTREAAEANLLTASERLILNAHRDTIVSNVKRDRQARAWAREPEPGCCWFCAMLATRGAIYSSAAAAGRQEASQAKGMPDDATGFVNRYHNNCRCRVVPVFGAYEPPAQVRQWIALWNDATADHAGMKNKQQAWQDAFEGREVKHRGRGGSQGSQRQAPQRGGFEALTRDQIQNQISVTEGLKDSEWRTAQLKRLRARLAEMDRA